MIRRLLAIAGLIALAGCGSQPRVYGHVIPSANASANSEPESANSLPRGYSHVQ
jgi:predicted small lipoprotein YifL